MTEKRSNYESLEARAAATLPDNTTAEISPADVRGMFLDFLRTTEPGYGTLQINSPVLETFNALTPTKITAWEDSAISDADFISDTVTGEITISQPGIVMISIQISAEFTNNTLFFSVGSDEGFFVDNDKFVMSSVPGGRPVGNGYTGWALVGNTPAKFWLEARCNQGTENVTFTSAAFAMQIQPRLRAPVG